MKTVRITCFNILNQNSPTRLEPGNNCAPILLIESHRASFDKKIMVQPWREM